MAYRKIATVQQPIPLRYRCSSCGTEALAALVAESSASTVIPSRMMDDYDYKTQNKLYRRAFKGLKAKVRKFYNKEPQNWYRNIRCQCPNCSHVEPWGNDPDKKVIKPISIIVPLVLIVWIASMFLNLDASPLVYKLLSWIPISSHQLSILRMPILWLLELVLILGIALLWYIFSPKNIKRKATIRSLPADNLPHYEKTEKQMLEIVEGNLNQRIVDDRGSDVSMDELTGQSNSTGTFNR